MFRAGGTGAELPGGTGTGRAATGGGGAGREEPAAGVSGGGDGEGKTCTLPGRLATAGGGFLNRGGDSVAVSGADEGA